MRAKRARRLATAVSQLRGENWKGGDTELPVTACWEDVANIVDTRSAKQCHSKWLEGIYLSVTIISGY